MLMPLFIDYLLSSEVIGVIREGEEIRPCQYLTFYNSWYTLRYGVTHQLAPPRHPAVPAAQAQAEVPFFVENFFGKKKSSAVDMVFQKSDKIYFMENLFWDRHSFEKLKLASG